jgi:CRP/FNR family cyclic AMP-dependent transcriptional regulator
MYLHPLLSQVPSDERAEFVQQIELRSYKRNDVVREVNDATASIYCVASGLLRVAVAGGCADEPVTTDFLTRDELYLSSAFDGTRNLAAASLVAALPCSVYVIPWIKFEDLSAKYPPVLIGLVTLAVKRTSMLRKQLRRVSSLNSDSLIGHALHDLTELAPSGDSGYDKRITQSVIASYTGLSREKVNKTMRDFEIRGLVQKGERGVQIPPHFALSDFGAVEDSPEPSVKRNDFLLPGSSIAF